MTARVSPSATAISMSWSALIPPKLSETFLTSSRSPMGDGAGEDALLTRAERES